jgi:glycerophosphoryl diester phosphodiesterase
LFGGKKGIAIASFDRKILHYLQVHHRAQHLYLVSRSVPRTIPSGVQGLILGACNVNQTVLKRLASRYRLFVWTVDDPAELQRVRRLPIDGIITNRLESFSWNIR